MGKSSKLKLLLLILVPLQAHAGPGPYLGNGIKVGETSHHSTIVWVRLTKTPSADFNKLPIFTEGLPLKARDKSYKSPMPIDVLPGTKGQARVRYWPADKSTNPEKTFLEYLSGLLKGKDQDFKETSWRTVNPDQDFIHSFLINDLLPDKKYEYLVEARLNENSEISSSMEGSFHTAPLPETTTPVRFIVSTCQAIRSIDSGAEGHIAYKQMLKFAPHFFVHTGDILYYDKAPFCKNQAQARAKWNLMFSYGHNQKFHRYVSSYFIKDDHDTLKNDCWSGQTYGELTFDQGLAIFREQVPMSPKTYRTFRWGKDLQIWLTENRDFRSSNRMEDGPDKTILGKEQLQWLKEGIQKSNATYKIVISPGPIVGPDKPKKRDNHSNKVFAYEGQLLRDFLSQQKNTYVICGDRHWQYCSKDPKTGLIELGCGPINDQHTFGGNPGEDPVYHKYFNNKGGFLGITVQDGKAKAEWYGANEGKDGQAILIHTEQL